MWRTGPPIFTGAIMHCLIRQEPIDISPGAKFLRLRLGTVYQGHHNIHFEEDCFEDGEIVKWVCQSCASIQGIIACYLDEEYCALCKQEFDLESEDVVVDMLVRVEEVTVKIGRTGVPTPVYSNVGHVHLECAADDWGLPVCNFDLERDVPSCP